MIAENFTAGNMRWLPLNIVSIALVFFMSSCMHPLLSDSSNDGNILKEGFIGTDMLQISLVVHPDSHVKGLVARRENARNKAENNFAYLLGKRIAEYRKANIPSCKTANEEILANHAKGAMKDALKIAEYFNEDESIAVIVRISRKNIREVFECPKAAEEKSSNEKDGGKK